MPGLPNLNMKPYIKLNHHLIITERSSMYLFFEFYHDGNYRKSDIKEELIAIGKLGTTQKDAERIARRLCREKNIYGGYRFT